MYRKAMVMNSDETFGGGTALKCRGQGLAWKSSARRGKGT